MLEHARAGSFSHVAVENAERFGGNDSEALTAIDALHEPGIAVRFADYPDLDPYDPDDRILVSLSFTLTRRESMKLGQRVTGGLHAKLRNGGFVGKAPDGYLNCEEKVDHHEKGRGSRYSRWIEPDPEQFKVWRTAWDHLLSEQYSLASICEALHARGYHFRSGRSFVTPDSTGERKHAVNTLSRSFKNWFYAGWVVSEKARIPPKTVRGQWPPLISTEELEAGLAILAARSKHRPRTNTTHDYLLRGLVHVQMHDGNILRLSGSTSNAGRPNGGTAYYCISSSSINIRCDLVDDQIKGELMRIQVDPEHIPEIRASYTDDLARRLGIFRTDQRQELTRRLKEVDGEETRSLRLYSAGKLTDRAWDQLWSEWNDRKRTLRHALDSLDVDNETHISNLDAAISVIAKVGVLYSKLDRSNQKKLLREMVNRIVLSPEGAILRMELLPPFAYLKEVTDRVCGSAADTEETKTSREAGLCFAVYGLGTPSRTRTCASASGGQRSIH